MLLLLLLLDNHRSLGLAGRPSPPHTHTLREAKRETASFHPPSTAAAHQLTRRLATAKPAQPGCRGLPWLAARWAGWLAQLAGGRAGRRWLWLARRAYVEGVVIVVTAAAQYCDFPADQW